MRSTLPRLTMKLIVLVPYAKFGLVTAKSNCIVRKEEHPEQHIAIEKVDRKWMKYRKKLIEIKRLA